MNKTIKAHQEAEQKLEKSRLDVFDSNYYQTVKQTSKQALQEMKEELEEIENNLRKYHKGYCKETQKPIRDKIKQIDEVLENGI